MKSLKKMMALALAMVMVLAMGLPVFADDYGTANQAHTITITSNGTGVHNYEAYQVFKGNLNAEEGVLSDIQWGAGVNGDALLTALKANDTTKTAIGEAADATAVAKVLEAQKNNASFLEAFADVVSANLTSTKAGTGASSGATPNKATVSVEGDGYYFIKDTTPQASLADGDTASKFMLQVVKDIAITAKDTVLTPDKEILEAQGQGQPAKVKAGTAAVGDTVKFEVTIPVPDTTAYKDHFWFIMNDQLPAGLTFTGIESVTIKDRTLAADATGTAAAGTYTLTTKTGSGEYAAFTAPTDAVAAEGGQAIKVVFNNFKSYVETNSLIGENAVVTYTAVVNDDAVYGSTGNKNEVTFTYSNDPNHDYDGDEPGPDSQDPTGTTPKSETTTYVAGIEILKVDGSNGDNPLANAEFEISSEDYNKTVTKGVKYEVAPYTLKDGETLVGSAAGDYWKLKDGSYTTQDPNAEGMNTTQYDSTTTKYVQVKWEKVVVEPGTAKKVTFITGSDGIIDVKGLKPGTYTIKETHAPDGYNKIDDTITIVIDWDKAADGKTGEFKLGTGTTEGVELIADGTGANASAKAIYKIQIRNNKGQELPSTGGMGTTIFYIVGAILVLGAGILLVTRRRMNAN